VHVCCCVCFSWEVSRVPPAVMPWGHVQPWQLGCAIADGKGLTRSPDLLASIRTICDGGAMGSAGAGTCCPVASTNTSGFTLLLVLENFIMLLRAKDEEGEGCCRWPYNGGCTAAKGCAAAEHSTSSERRTLCASACGPPVARPHHSCRPHTAASAPETVEAARPRQLAARSLC